MVWCLLTPLNLVHHLYDKHACIACAICGNIFYREEPLAEHYLGKHLKEGPPYRCNEHYHGYYETILNFNLHFAAVKHGEEFDTICKEVKCKDKSFGPLAWLLHQAAEHANKIEDPVVVWRFVNPQMHQEYTKKFAFQYEIYRDSLRGDSERLLTLKELIGDGRVSFVCVIGAYVVGHLTVNSERNLSQPFAYVEEYHCFPGA